MKGKNNTIINSGSTNCRAADRLYNLKKVQKERHGLLISSRMKRRGIPKGKNKPCLKEIQLNEELIKGQTRKKKILQMRTPVYQADIATIEDQFMLAVKEVKKEIGNDYAAAHALTAAAAERMFSELAKDQDMENPKVTPEQ